MYSVDRQTFEQYVKDGVDAIPEEFKKEFNNVAFVVEDYPSAYQQQKIRLQKHSLLFGLYEGVPTSKRNSGYSGALPDKITIFKTPIEYYARDDEHLRRLISNTVWHEIAHHFGMNEQEVRAAEKNRGHVY